jgi:hypothetical protein
MSSETKPTAGRDAVLGGLVLILIGAAALMSQLWPDLDRYIPSVIGLGLLAVFAVGHSYLSLVGAGIMTGLGVALLISGAFPQWDADGPAATLGLGAGFVSIWLISRLMALKEHHWWPLIPGTILLTVGSALSLELAGMMTERAVELVGPVILLVVGGLIVIGAYIRRRGSGAGMTTG